MSREKQIEEIKNVLIKTHKRARSGQDDYMQDRYAEAFYNAGYRKQSEVIHCSDCGVPHNEWTGCPKLNGLVTRSDFYCAYAEPKMKGGE